MSLIYKRSPNQPSFLHTINDYLGEIVPFAKRIDKKLFTIPLILFKTIEWGIYRWYKTSIRRFYGVKGNELIYMITRRCNDRCAKCGIWKTSEDSSDRIDISYFLNCLYTLHKNLYQVTLTGGEPLLFIDDVLSIARKAQELSVPMITVTNGVLLTESFLKEYGELGHTLVISLDTINQNKWLEFRGRNHYEQVFYNIKLAKNILGNKLKIQSVFAIETEEDIREVQNFCKDLNISHVIQPYMDFGGTWNGSDIQAESLKSQPCQARKNICVYPNGDVIKCFDHYRIPLAIEPLGNIVQEDIVSILCKKRATEVSRIMKTCNYPCKLLSCNIPPVLEGASC